MPSVCLFSRLKTHTFDSLHFTFISEEVGLQVANFQNGLRAISLSHMQLIRHSKKFICLQSTGTIHSQFARGINNVIHSCPWLFRGASYAVTRAIQRTASPVGGSAAIKAAFHCLPHVNHDRLPITRRTSPYPMFSPFPVPLCPSPILPHCAYAIAQRPLYPGA